MQRRTLLLLGLLASAGCQKKTPTPGNIDDELAQARKEGVITEWSELKMSTVPDSKNAALVYKEADRIYKALPKAQTKAYGVLLAAALKSGKPGPAAAVLQHQAALLTLAERATALPDYAMQRDWSQGMALLFPEFATARQLTRLLCLRAELARVAGKPLDALQDLARAARIGPHQGTEPTLIAALVHLACSAITDRCFVRLVQQYGNRADVLAAARATFPAFGALPNLKHAYSFELPAARIMIQQSRAGKGFSLFGEDDKTDATTKFLQDEIRRDPKILDAWEVSLIRYWRAVYMALDQVALPALAQRLAEIEKRYDAKKNRACEIVAILSPVMTQAVAKFQSITAQSLLREQLVTLLEAPQKTGTFPEHPTLPNDPFTGQPLHYRMSAEGFVLYSVGKNGKDDNGSEEKDKENYPKDIVVRYGKDAF